MWGLLKFVLLIQLFHIVIWDIICFTLFLNNSLNEVCPYMAAAETELCYLLNLPSSTLGSHQHYSCAWRQRSGRRKTSHWKLSCLIDTTIKGWPRVERRELAEREDVEGSGRHQSACRRDGTFEERCWWFSGTAPSHYCRWLLEIFGGRPCRTQL